MITKNQIEVILAQASGMPIGNLLKAQEFFAAGQYDKVEEIFRGNYGWFQLKGIPYDLTNGIAVAYHDNGQLRCEFTYKNGKKHGVDKSWHPNGQAWEECNYENGELYGAYKVHDSEGLISVNSHYINFARPEADGLVATLGAIEVFAGVPGVSGFYEVLVEAERDDLIRVPDVQYDKEKNRFTQGVLVVLGVVGYYSLPILKRRN